MENYKLFKKLILLSIVASLLFISLPKAYSQPIITVNTRGARGPQPYDPGETVIVYGIVRNVGGGPVPGATVRIAIVAPAAGGAWAGTATTDASGRYRYSFTLSSNARPGVWSVSASTVVGGVNVAARTTFQVSGGVRSGGTSTDWAIMNPRVTPPSPTTEDLVRIHAQIMVIASIEGLPQAVEVLCVVDGAPVGGGAVVVRTSTMEVYTPARRYPAGTHVGYWVIDPNSRYYDPNRGNNRVDFRFTVSAPTPPFDFALTASPSTSGVEAGGAASYSVNVELVAGAPEEVSLSVSGLPAGATATFSPPSGNPTYVSTLSILTSESTPPGSYPLTITASGGGKTKTAIVQLNVKEAVKKDFTISLSNLEVKIKQGGSFNLIASVLPAEKFDSPVVLTISGLPSGVSGVFNPDSGNPPFSSNLLIEASESAAPGTYAPTITGVGDGKTHSATLRLIVEEKERPATPVIQETTTQTTQRPTELLEEYGFFIIIGLLIVIAALAVAIAARKKG